MPQKSSPLVVVFTAVLFAVIGVAGIIIGSLLETGFVALTQLAGRVLPSSALPEQASLIAGGAFALIYISSMLYILVGIGLWRGKKWAAYLGIALTVISIIAGVFVATSAVGSLIADIILAGLAIASLRKLK